MEAQKRAKHTDRRAHVLVVDADSIQLDSICRGVFLYGHRCTRIDRVSDAIDLLNRPSGDRVDILITDFAAEGNEARSLIQHARALHPHLPIIALCGLHTTDEVEQLREAGILILRRPFDPNGLDGAIRDLVA